MIVESLQDLPNLSRDDCEPVRVQVDMIGLELVSEMTSRALKRSVIRPLLVHQS